MDDERIFSVGELTGEIRAVLEEGFGEIRVAGEISNFRAPGSGHLYFTLKDAEATLAAVMFRGAAQRLGFVPKDGQAVVARGAITVYEARGQYQIQVLDLKPQGQGSLQQQFEALKKKLLEEGLFEADRKKSLPDYPEIVGIVTSLQGAVLQDFSKILGRRAPGVLVQVRGVRVQGVGAADEIAAAVKAFARAGDVDVIIVARGGGSLEDLWEFNTETVARALAGCEIPTISAIGHETDFTIADFVADVRAATPSMAAELLSQNWVEAPEVVRQAGENMRRALSITMERKKAEWMRLTESYVFREPRRIVQQLEQRIDDLSEGLRRGLRAVVEKRRFGFEKMGLRWQSVDPREHLLRRRERIEQLGHRLRVLSPEGTLARGYAVVTDEKGKVIKEAKLELVGKVVRVRLALGVAQAKIEEIEARKKN
jgi:exodeoxyribonuclease VII large subunit